MSNYLDEFADAWDNHPGGATASPCMCLAAYNENMALLAGDRSDGIHTYLVNHSHTVKVREAVGYSPVIAAEAAVVLTDDPGQARAVGRAHLATYIGSRSHQRKFAALGFGPEDFTDGGSDRLIDGLIVHGDEAIKERIDKHIGAGADHVGVQVLGTSSLDEDVAAWGHIANLILNQPG